MRKIRTVLVDDEAPARRRMAKLVQQVEQCDLVGDAESGQQAIQLINQLNPDLLLLDIQLKDMTGFDVLRQIENVNPKIIFITAYDSFAIQAFEENAVDYLLKPYKDSRFFHAIDRVVDGNYIQRNDQLVALLGKMDELSGTSKIKIPEGKTTHLVDPHTLVHIQANSYHSVFHFEDTSSLLVRITLKSLESILPEGFIRINKSVIINKDKILSVRELKSSTEMKMANGMTFNTKKELVF